MCIRLRSVFILSGFLLLAGCGGTLSTQTAIQESIAAMGGAEKLKTIGMIVLKGSGTQTFLGQGVKAGDPGPPATVSLVEVYDYANGRAAIEYDLATSPSSPYGPFKSHRREVLTKYGEGTATRPVGYIMTGINRPAFVLSPGALYGYAFHASPEIGMHRTYLNIVLDIYSTVDAGQMTEDREFGGKTVKFGTAKTKQGEPLDLYFDPETKLLAGYEITETHPIMGDIRSTYTFEDFKPVDDVPFPHRVKLHGEVGNSADIQYTSVTLGDASAEQMLTLPESAASEATKVMSGDYVPMELVLVAPGVFHAKGYNNNSMVVEFPRWLVVVETPQREMHSKVLHQLLRKQFPGKPVQYVAYTHPHHDHIGGVRGFAALGATVLVEKNHEAEMKRIIDARHTYPPDELERNRSSQQNVGGIEVYEGKKVISDGARTLELHAIPNQSVAIMIFAYLPSERVLFQSDVSPQLRPSDAKFFFDAITKLNLRPDRIVGGHGGITSFADFTKTAPGS